MYAHHSIRYLRRHSARVHTDTPQHVTLVHNSHGVAVFRAVDGAFLAGRAAANHNEVEVFASPQLAQGLSQQLFIGFEVRAIRSGGSDRAGESARWR